MDYALLKLLHQGAVLLSITGFFARGLGSLTGAAWVGSRAARTVPHVVDTVLLLSALALAWTLRLNPAHAPWLLAKLLALVVYIGLGLVTLRPRLSRPMRGLCFGAALATFGYIVSVAITKQPGGFLFSAGG
jgi:uncharacterized membrane protein SirB2